MELARRAGVGQSTLSLVERGHLDRLALRTVRSIFGAAGASYDGVVTWRGGQLDRLLDAGHAAIVEQMVALLRAYGWDVATEVSFNRFGDRGSIDVLALHIGASTALVVEVKTELTAIEETVRRLDVKVRIGADVARERFGSRPRHVGRLLVLPDTTAARQRVAAFPATFAIALPARTAAVRRWLRDPSVDAGTAGILFLRMSNGGGKARGRRQPGRGPRA